MPAFETVNKTGGNFATPTSRTAHVRSAVLADINDAFFENGLSCYLVPELRVGENLYIGQYTALGLDEDVLRIVLSRMGLTRNPAQPDLNVFDFFTGEIADRVEFMDNRIVDEHLVSESGSHFGVSMRAVQHQKFP